MTQNYGVGNPQQNIPQNNSEGFWGNSSPQQNVPQNYPNMQNGYPNAQQNYGQPGMNPQPQNGGVR